MILIKHEFKQNLKTLLIWSGVIGILTFVFMLMFPAYKDQMAEMQKSIESMGGFTAAMGMDKISIADALGFYGIEAGAMIAIGGAMFAALTAISILSKEEGAHTAEFLLTHPLSRKSILTEKLIFVLIQIICFNIICFIFAGLSFVAIDENIDISNFILFHLAQIILQIEVGGICFLISAFQRRANIGLGIGIAALLYFLSLFVNVSENAEFLKYVTPFQYADAANIFSAEKLDGALILIGIIIATICIVLAYSVYCKRDIAS